ncbi:DUF6616 family protein [Microvirga sp. W0021]|uniref:DUF6616 family protein n=1 Tax=Hohaiivirga grylli TaxID=3133970 RepID=A0ABV0BH64_9HYPH
MSYYLSELYSPKPAWLALSAQQRQQFFATIGAGMQQLADFGIEPIAFGEVASNKLHPAPQQFYAFWKFPNEEAADSLLAGIAATGWHDYFDTINAAGASSDMSAHLQQLASL